MSLEPQAFDLLIYLISHRERVVGKDELIDAIWKGRIVSESALTTRINAVRKAIGDSGEQQRLTRRVSPFPGMMKNGRNFGVDKQIFERV